MQPHHRRFETTRWSVVVLAGDSRNRESTVALKELCERYWYPVYAFIRSLVRDPDLAEDLTQAFFVHVLEDGVVGVATPERGRFRSFLRTAARNFVRNEREKERAKKRGGDCLPISLDLVEASARYRVEPVGREPPDVSFEKRWARALLDRALDRLDAENPKARDRIARLKPLLTGEEERGCAAVAEELLMTESAVRVAVHRLRRRFGQILRDEVAETVDDPSKVESEIRHLLSIVAS